MEYSTVQYRTRELLFESLAQLAVVSRRHVVRLSWLWTFRVCVLVVSRFLFFYVEMLLQQTYSLCVSARVSFPNLFFRAKEQVTCVCLFRRVI